MSYIKIVDETKKCDVFLNENPTAEQIADLIEQGFIEGDWEHGWDGFLYVKGYAPVEPVEHKNEAIRMQRQVRFAQEADPLKLDYDEAVARGEEQAEEKKQTWLAKKDEIRAALPYISEAGDGA